MYCYLSAIPNNSSVPLCNVKRLKRQSLHGKGLSIARLGWGLCCRRGAVHLRAMLLPAGEGETPPAKRDPTCRNPIYPPVSSEGQAPHCICIYRSFRGLVSHHRRIMQPARGVGKPATLRNHGRMMCYLVKVVLTWSNLTKGPLINMFLPS